MAGSGGPRHKRKACKPNCREHATFKRGCPLVCPKDCDAHASACPERQAGGLVFRKPKGKSRRTVPLPPELVEALRQHKEIQDAERKHARDVWEEHDLVFCQVNGRPLDPRKDWYAWKALLAAAGVRDARVHDGRHGRHASAGAGRRHPGRARAAGSLGPAYDAGLHARRIAADTTARIGRLLFPSIETRTETTAETGS